MKKRLYLVRTTAVLTCMWVSTDDPKTPLACVWTGSTSPQAVSTASFTDEAERVHLCA
jgi:hypothetical protein